MVSTALPLSEWRRRGYLGFASLATVAPDVSENLKPLIDRLAAYKDGKYIFPNDEVSH